MYMQYNKPNERQYRMFTTATTNKFFADTE